MYPREPKLPNSSFLLSTNRAILLKEDEAVVPPLSKWWNEEYIILLSTAIIFWSDSLFEEALVLNAHIYEEKGPSTAELIENPNLGKFLKRFDNVRTYFRIEWVNDEDKQQVAYGYEVIRWRGSVDPWKHFEYCKKFCQFGRKYIPEFDTVFRRLLDELSGYIDHRYLNHLLHKQQDQQRSNNYKKFYSRRANIHVGRPKTRKFTRV